MQKRLLFTALIAVTALSVTLAGADDGLEFKAELTGAEEVPNPVITETTGEAKFEVDDEYTRIEFELEIEDATDVLGAAGAHIHCAPRGQNGSVTAFLAGVVVGGLAGDVEIKAVLTDQNVLDVGCGANVFELVQSMRAGNTYVNVHSVTNPAGEIRGQIRVEDDDDE